MTDALARNALKVLGLWITLLFGSTVGAMLTGASGSQLVSDGPATTVQALMLVSGFHAMVLAIIAGQSQLGSLKLAVLIFVALFGVQSFMMQIETLYFIENVGIPIDALVRGLIANMITALCAGCAAALLWRSDKLITQAPTSRLTSRVALISVAYVGIYFLAGYFIAWRSETLRSYYANGLEIELIPLLAFQTIRGVLWTLLALGIAQSLSGSFKQRAIIVGVAFSILAAAQLMYPNVYMPWDIRKYHLVELGLSNFVFGVLAVIALFYNRDKSTNHID